MIKQRVSLKEWGKLSVLIAVFWGILFVVGGTALGSVFGSTGAIVGSLLGTAVFIGVMVSTFVRLIVGAFISKYLGFYKISPFWKIFQVSFIGSVSFLIVIMIISGSSDFLRVFDVVTLLLMVVTALVTGFVGSQMLQRFNFLKARI